MNALRIESSLTSQTTTPEINLNTGVMISHPEIKIPQKGLSLLVFFTDRSCVSCLQYEIPNLNAFYRNHANRMHIYLFGINEKYLTWYEANFPYQLLKNQDRLFGKVNVRFINPIAVVVDSRGVVQTIYRAEVGNSKKSEKFYTRMQSLFQSL